MAGLIMLLSALAVTSLADNRGRSQKLICIDNLRQIGEGFEKWRFEHGDSAPWLVESTNGGFRGISVGLPWIDFTCLSNFVESPRIFACPSDSRAVPKTASNWGSGPNGFQNSGFRNNSVSYTVGLHSYFNSPREFLSSDRNLKPNSVNSSCGPAGLSSGVTVINWIFPSTIVWSNDVHGLLGNVLVTDGSVNEVSSPELQNLLRTGQDDGGNLHLLVP